MYLAIYDRGNFHINFTTGTSSFRKKLPKIAIAKTAIIPYERRESAISSDKRVEINLSAIRRAQWETVIKVFQSVIV